MFKNVFSKIFGGKPKAAPRLAHLVNPAAPAAPAAAAPAARTARVPVAGTAPVAAPTAPVAAPAAPRAATAPVYVGSEVPPETLCQITPDMTTDQIRDRLALLYRRHNRAASSLDGTLRDEAEVMLEAIAMVREKHFGGPSKPRE